MRRLRWIKAILHHLHAPSDLLDRQSRDVEERLNGHSNRGEAAWHDVEELLHDLLLVDWFTERIQRGDDVGEVRHKVIDGFAVVGGYGLALLPQLLRLGLADAVDTDAHH
uniref:Uncharacterized protein n=1 Tax=Arundo donax TaxID=35708 RepID=A0A0A9H4B9_ARUDO